MKNFFYLLSLMLITVFPANAKDFKLTSPDGKVAMNISVDKTVSYSVKYSGLQVLMPSAVSMTVGNEQLGVNAKIKNVKERNIDETISTVAYIKNKVINKCNELSLTFNGGYGITFRAYDNGVAYRFNIDKGGKNVIVNNEQSEYNFPDKCSSYQTYANKNGSIEEQFSNSFEGLYHHTTVKGIDKDRLVILPFMVELPSNIKVCISEVNQFSYPGMFLRNADSSNSVKGIFAPYPKTMEQGGHNNLQMLVKERENYIAKVNGKRDFPWRVIGISADDKDMTDNDIVFCLADNCKLSDTSWIKPGKVAWDWWNDWNLSNVDFKAGVNNDTYKYYIDFASKNGIEYVILDEGWAVNGEADMMKVIPEIDLKGLIDYAKSKNVGIILWGGYKAMDKDMENLCKHYSEMGVKGFKVDFMDRDDQIIVDFYNRMAKTAAKYKLMVDFHGAFKPSGLNRTYPNVINYEGVHGLEQMKWEPTTVDQVTYDLQLPFIRQFAGPMDYTQGAMRNSTRDTYHPCNSEPMSQGTRCHQLAEYIIFESPLNMLCDAPTEYEKEPTYTKFLASIPTTWDETHVIAGKVGEYIITARRKGNDWYIGGLNNWNERNIEINLSFIKGLDTYKKQLYKDGVNANKRASDYKYTEDVTLNGNKLQISMKNGGGFLLKLSK